MGPALKSNVCAPRSVPFAMGSLISLSSKSSNTAPPPSLLSVSPTNALFNTAFASKWFISVFAVSKAVLGFVKLSEPWTIVVLSCWDTLYQYLLLLLVCHYSISPFGITYIFIFPCMGQPIKESYLWDLIYKSPSSLSAYVSILAKNLVPSPSKVVTVVLKSELVSWIYHGISKFIIVFALNYCLK